jgi:peptidoglycan/xylan/chitin deacetylase (PgdA/CDA1 family)
MSWLLLPALLWLLWFTHRYGWWRSPVSYQQPRILMYHQIAEHQDGARFNGLRVPLEMFEKQLQWLTQNNWNFFTMADLVKLKNELPEKSVVLTFDDGYLDNLTNALPLMKKYNARATLYLVIDRHDNDWSTNKKKHHDSGELARDPKLTDQQVTELLDSGCFELGGHTLSHANLNSLNTAQKIAEITESKTTLEEMFKTEVTSFAYPFGIFSEEDVDIVKQSGYTNAVTTDAGIDDLSQSMFNLKRVKISGKDNFYAFKLRIKNGIRGLQK